MSRPVREGHGALPPRCFAIVPAAGRSIRMGQPKLLLPWHGRAMIEHTLAAWQNSRVTRTVVVVHPDDQPLADVCRAAGCLVWQPDVPPPDMKASIRSGLNFIETQFEPIAADAWLVAPADLPTLASTVIDQLIARHDPCEPRILAPTAAGHPGHPLLFPWAVRGEIDRLGAEQGLNTLLTWFPPRQIECGPLARPEDVDTSEDYRRLCSE